MARPDSDQTGIRKLNMAGGKSFAVSLPVDIVRQLGWRKGATLMVRRQGNRVIIEKVST